MSGSRSNTEEMPEDPRAAGKTDQVKRGLGSLKNRRQQLEDALNGADSGTRKQKRKASDEESE